MTRSRALLAALMIDLFASLAHAEDVSESRSMEARESAKVAHEPTMPPEGDLVALEQRPKAELLVDVKLEGNDPDARYEIRAVENDSVLLSCHRGCTFRIWPGRYRLQTRNADGRVVGDDAVELDRDTRIDISLPSTFDLVLGGAVTAAGVAAMIAGVVLYRGSPCTGSCSHEEAAHNEVGLGLLLGGAVTLPIGFVLLESGWSTDISQIPMDSATRGSIGNTSTLPFRGLRCTLAF
ncbi:MAG: hypothetical protein QM784_24450 [Polyangiaceae bacterium]